jgi:hypothetical protein
MLAKLFHLTTGGLGVTPIPNPRNLEAENSFDPFFTPNQKYLRGLLLLKAVL